MESTQKQNPRQGLPDEGSALPSEVRTTEGKEMAGDAKRNSTPKKTVDKADVADRQQLRIRSQAILQAVKDFAFELVCDSSIQEEDWDLHLRVCKQTESLRLKEAEFLRILAEAKNRRDGRIELLPPGTKLNTRPIPWIWEGIIMASAVNLVYAAPKCGKTRLMLGLAASVGNKMETFLGRPITSKDKKVLIIGPDQPEVVWADMLKEFRLMDETNHLHPCIAGLTCSGMRFALNEEGIRLIEEQAKLNPGLIVILDSYQRAIAPLGLDENRPEASVPLTKLMEAVAPYETTVIIIHHANKHGGNGSMSSAARGTTALTAVPDQLISMKPFSGEGSSRESKEIELTTEGRGGKPVALLLELEEDGRTWVSLGSPSKRRAEERDLKLVAEMTERQRALLEVAIAHFNEFTIGMTKKEMMTKLNVEGQKGGWDVEQRIEALIKKGLMDKKGKGLPTTGRPANLYAPSAKGLAMCTPKA